MTMLAGMPDPPSPGTVLVYAARKAEPEHERAVHFELGTRIAGLLGASFGGAHRDGIGYQAPVYLIPTDTLIGAKLAQRLGVRREEDLFGGVAPHTFVPTKAITHGLLDPHAFAPEGWSHEFSQRVKDSVLDGITAFSIGDAQRAGIRLLRQGPVRIKPVLATAGRGQALVSSLDELTVLLEQMDSRHIAECGLVLEENLDEVETFSVGQVRIGGLTASYVGTQCLTPDNLGEMVYGGSELIVVRGDFEQLLKLELSDEWRLAIAKARIYDTAATACYPGLLASRRNYDIAIGIGRGKARRCGVLEQSWRIGGASGAEIAALEAFHADEGLQAVRASTIELFGSSPRPPPGAREIYRGVDPQIGPISKYIRVEPYGN
ncbi:DUF3182 family protein [Pollutimonas sp. H1-120]|uniref:DUF3182 family protein n=1 Tax=Pollutimonas sp. H1-120 TaxID=3148824 RepID=UPI003B5197EC